MPISTTITWLRNVAIAAAILIPGPFLLWIILRNDVNIPFEDEWLWAQLLVREHAGTLTFNDIWMPHNEHRIFFPTLLILGLVKLFGWNITFESVLGDALLVLSQIPLYRMTRDTLGKNWGTVAFVLASAVFFSLGQVENIMWGFQIAWFMVMFCAMYTIDLLRVKTLSPVPPFLAAFLCFIASFSSAFGLLVPVIAVVTVALRRKFKLSDVAVWCGFTVVLALTYMHHIDAAMRGVAHMHVAASFSDRIDFFETYLGSPIAGWAGEDVSQTTGFYGLLWAAICVVSFYGSSETEPSERRGRLALALAFFARRRRHDGIRPHRPRHGRGSREPLYDAWWRIWLALIPITILFAVIASRTASRAFERGTYVVVAVAFAGLLYDLHMEGQVGYDTARGTVEYRRAALVALRNPEKGSVDDIEHVFPDALSVRHMVEQLARDGYWPLH